MIALILRAAGLDPTFIIGGDIPQLGTNAAAGQGDIFVIEADEYDFTFLGLRPQVAVITIVEWDHPDCYPTPESMQQAFREFLGLVPPQGLVVACGDDPGASGLVRGWGTAGLPTLITYGLNPDNAWRALDPRPNPYGGCDFTVQGTSKTGQIMGPVSLQVPGIHNVKNALAALVVADYLGISLSRAASVLAGFTGVSRRFEIKGQARGITVVDDYAHHPTEIQATLSAAKVRYPGRRLWAVFQPHTYSRTRALLNDFAAAFQDADHVILVDIFPAREVDDGSVHSSDIIARMRHPDAHYIGNLVDAANSLVGRLRPGDVLITLGAGDGYRVGEMVLQEADRDAARSRISYLPRITALAHALEARFDQRLLRDEPLAAHTTLRVGGPADLWLEVNSLDGLIEAASLAWQHAVPLLVLGNGANLLVSDRGVRGLVVHNRCQRMFLPREGAGGEVSGRLPVILESGVILPSLAHRLAQQGLSGLEWAVGVPGTIGGALVNNAGAYGVSIADNLVRAQLYSQTTGQREWYPVDWFEYGYRSSRLKRLAMSAGRERGERFIVLQAELGLIRKPPADIEKQMAAYSARRRASQPPGASIGSMFKNPPGDYAGRLIEAAELKGTRIGGAHISTVHANFFVNQGDAAAADFAALIDLARETVKARFNIELELEVEKIGDWGNE
jgi:UDP-N-acetylmuramate--alanine ligase